MSTDSFLFYDIETTGLNPCFDQVLQFAAIRTTPDLTEIERYEYRVRLNPDSIPHPKAMLTTGLSMTDMQQGDCEYEVIRSIHALMNTPNTCSLGYNTLGFDDEFLRFSFFRNLLTPYTHQYTNGCSRADIYPLTLLYKQFKPDVLHWPERNGKPSFKLEDLNAANGLASGQAHDAMVDVEATLALAKRLKANQRMWTYALDYFNKAVDSKRFDALPSASKHSQHDYRYGLVLAPELGYKRHYLAPVLYLGQHQLYRNQSIWLRLDEPDMSHAIQANDVLPYQVLIRKKMGEPPLTLPPEARYLDHLNDDSREHMATNLKWINQHIDTLDQARILTCQAPYPEIPHCDAQASLYQAGFPSPEDTRLNKRFTEASWPKKTALLDEISHPLYYSLSLRALGRSGIDLQTHQEAFTEYLHSVWSGAETQDAKGKTRFTPDDCLEAIESCYADSDRQETDALNALKQYVLERRGSDKSRSRDGSIT